MAASGYDWNADAETILNSAVIGLPGAVLSRTLEDGSPVPAKFLNRRIALNRWYRRTTDWSALWLNSSPGGLLPNGQPFDPVMRCFDRLERFDGEDRLTALVLRADTRPDSSQSSTLHFLSWQGNWALISQDNEDIFRSPLLACLPVAGTELQIARHSKPSRITAVHRSAEQGWIDWTWANGIVTLHSSEDSDTFLGFLIAG